MAERKGNVLSFFQKYSLQFESAQFLDSNKKYNAKIEKYFYNVISSFEMITTAEQKSYIIDSDAAKTVAAKLEALFPLRDVNESTYILNTQVQYLFKSIIIEAVNEKIEAVNEKIESEDYDEETEAGDYGEDSYLYDLFDDGVTTQDWVDDICRHDGYIIGIDYDIHISLIRLRAAIIKNNLSKETVARIINVLFEDKITDVSLSIDKPYIKRVANKEVIEDLVNKIYGSVPSPSTQS